MPAAFSGNLAFDICHLNLSTFRERRHPFCGWKMPYTANHLVGQGMSIHHPHLCRGVLGVRVRRPYLDSSLAFCLFADIGRLEGWEGICWAAAFSIKENVTLLLCCGALVASCVRRPYLDCTRVANAPPHRQWHRLPPANLPQGWSSNNRRRPQHSKSVKFNHFDGSTFGWGWNCLSWKSRHGSHAKMSAVLASTTHSYPFSVQFTIWEGCDGCKKETAIMRKSCFAESFMRVGEARGRGLQTGSTPGNHPVLAREILLKGSRKALPALHLISLTHDVILEVRSYLVRICRRTIVWK